MSFAQEEPPENDRVTGWDNIRLALNLNSRQASQPAGGKAVEALRNPGRPRPEEHYRFFNQVNPRDPWLGKIERGRQHTKADLRSASAFAHKLEYVMGRKQVRQAGVLHGFRLLCCPTLGGWSVLVWAKCVWRFIPREHTTEHRRIRWYGGSCRDCSQNRYIPPLRLWCEFNPGVRPTVRAPVPQPWRQPGRDRNV